jgi:flagellin-like hook-associated protein FlgL
VQINSSGTGINIVDQVSGPSLSIGPTGTGVDTSTELGIRTMSGSTPTSALNNGAGIRIIDNQTDPVNGQKDAAVNSDFRITLGNGQAFDVDLRPQDLTTVQSVLDRINQQFTAAIGQPPVISSAPPLAAGQFTASLPASGNGIEFSQTVTGGPIGVSELNNSPAAQDLGLLNGTADPTGATFTAQDRSGVSVNNVFTSLINLRNSLSSGDNNGITLAGTQLQTALNNLTDTQAKVGVYAQRVQTATSDQTSANTMNQEMTSQLQDVDYTTAAVQFNALRNQLQASYQVGAMTQNLSLLNFLH